MINFEGLDLLAEIGGVPADVDLVANAQRTRLELDDRDRRVAVIVSYNADALPRLLWRSGLRG